MPVPYSGLNVFVYSNRCRPSRHGSPQRLEVVHVDRERGRLDEIPMALEVSRAGREHRKPVGDIEPPPTDLWPVLPGRSVLTRPVVLDATALHHVVIDEHKPGGAVRLDPGVFAVRRIEPLLVEPQPRQKVKAGMVPAQQDLDGVAVRGVLHHRPAAVASAARHRHVQARRAGQGQQPDLRSGVGAGLDQTVVLQALDRNRDVLLSDSAPVGKLVSGRELHTRQRG